MDMLDKEVSKEGLPEQSLALRASSNRRTCLGVPGRVLSISKVRPSVLGAAPELVEVKTPELCVGPGGINPCMVTEGLAAWASWKIQLKSNYIFCQATL